MRPFATLSLIALMAIPTLPAQGLPSDSLFMTQARHALMQEEGSDGLQALVDGCLIVARELPDESREAMKTFAATPITTPPTAQISDLLRKLDGALQQAILAANKTPFDPFPSATSYTPAFSSRGDLMLAEGRDRRYSPIDLCRLLMVDAHRLAAEGNTRGAIERLRQGLRLSDTLCDHLRDPNLWVIATQALSQNIRLISEIVGTEIVDEPTLIQLQEDLDSLGLGTTSVQEIVGEMVEGRKRMIRQAEVDLSMRSRLQSALTNRHLDAQLEEVELDLFRGSQSFNEEIDRLITTLDEPANTWSSAIRHYDGRTTFRQAVVEVAVVLNVARAWCAVAQAQIELERGAVDPTAVDPFSGAPILVSARNVHSVGPDGVDDGGLTTYQTGQRLFTGGDLISPR